MTACIMFLLTCNAFSKKISKRLVPINLVLCYTQPHPKKIHTQVFGISYKYKNKCKKSGHRSPLLRTLPDSNQRERLSKVCRTEKIHTRNFQIMCSHLLTMCSTICWPWALVSQGCPPPLSTNPQLQWIKLSHCYLHIIHYSSVTEAQSRNNTPWPRWATARHEQ